jgi:hypothetical protein
LASTPGLYVRVEPEIAQAARESSPELSDLTTSELLRVGLLVLAGHDVGDAVPLAARKRGNWRGTKIGPRKAA